MTPAESSLPHPAVQSEGARDLWAWYFAIASKAGNEDGVHISLPRLVVRVISVVRKSLFVVKLKNC